MMIFVQRVLHVFFIVSSPVWTTERAPLLSLWGKVADFTFGCNHWRLNSDVSIPTLHEFTLCLNLKLKAPVKSQWIAFMYRHPEVQCAELGLEGNRGRLVVWLFGTQWTSPPINLHLSQWHSVCLTWSRSKDRPALYVNGSLTEINADDLVSASSISTTCCKPAPNGTLTLGAAHSLVNGNIHVISATALWGKLSLFRLWGRERSRQEVTSLTCTEGELVKWERDNWDTQTCAPLPDSSLRCEWSSYRVSVLFAIFRYDKNNTGLDAARDIANHWLDEVLPADFYLHRVSVFEVTRSTGGHFVNASYEETLVRWVTPNINRFDCLAHVRVSPCLDVAAVQNKMHTKLQIPYNDPSGLLQLLAAAESIHTTPVENVPTTPDGTTPSSPVTNTFTTSAATSSSIVAVETTTSTVTNTPGNFTQGPANTSRLYFEVKVNVSIRGGCDTEQILSAWLSTSLPEDVMRVLDLQLLPKAPRRKRGSTSDDVSVHQVFRTSCVFQVQVMMSLTESQEMEEQIRYLLLRPYSNGSVSIATEDIQIHRIYVYKCLAETLWTGKGRFEWPDTSGSENASRPCPKNPRHNATRHCKLGLKTQWMKPDLKDCPLVVESIPDLDQIDVTAENSQDVVEMIEGLLSNHSKLSYQELDTVLNKLEDVVNISVVTPNLGQAVINIISDILESDSYLRPFTNMILNITEVVGDHLVGFEGSSSLVAPAVAVTVVDIDPGQYASLTFGVSSGQTGLMPEIFINRYPFNSTVAFISLPSVLQHSFPQSPNQRTQRVQFQFYGIPELFRSSQTGQILNSFVVSASVTNATAPIRDLDEDVRVTLHHLKPKDLYMDIECVYWNFNKNNGGGGWDDYGCRKHDSNMENTTCLCDHLTHFGVLLDVSRTPVDPANEQILTIITYTGCGVSSLFLGITLLTYTAFEKLRRDYPSQILINLSLALLGLNLVFLVNSWLSSWGLHAACVAAASLLHYFLLASFTWMGLEAVNMYFALVKVFNVYVPSYIFKFCVLGWGVPLAICVLVLIVNREAYGRNLYTHAHTGLESLDNSDNFCWLQDGVTFYVSVVAYAALVFLFNIAVFVVVLIQLRHMRANSPARTRGGLMHKLKGVASLTLLLGLTWTLGFFTWGPGRVVLLYMFSGLNTLQGIFIFLFHCLMKENVRKQWRIHLCFGRFRLNQYSEWSNSASVGATAKPRSNLLRPSFPSVYSVKSSSTDSTSASSDSSQRDSSCKRPKLGLFVSSLALPRAQKGASGALPSQGGMNRTPGWRNLLLTQQD